MLFFNIILPMSLTSGVMIAAILLVRPLFHRWKTHGILSLLWICACVMLLVPFRPSSPASVYNAAIEQPGISEAFTVKPFTVTTKSSYVFITAEGENTGDANAEHTIITEEYGNINGEFSQYDVSDSMPLKFAATVWGIGFCAILCYTIASALLLRHRFRGAVPRIDLTSDVVGISGFKRKVHVYASSRTAGTVTYGFIRPRVILPIVFNYEDKTALNYVLLHELQHIHNLDAFVNLLWLAVLCVHWFNPFVWYGWICMRRDMETRCDAQVVERVGAKQRAGYAQTLLNIVTIRRSRNNMFPLAFGSSSAKERIKNVLLYRPAKKRAVCAALTVLFCCVAFFATNPIQSVIAEQTEQIVNTDGNIYIINEALSPIDNVTENSSLFLLYQINPIGFDGERYQDTYTLCNTFDSYSEIQSYFAKTYCIESEILTKYIGFKPEYQESFGFGINDYYGEESFSIKGQSICFQNDQGIAYYALIDISTYKSDNTDPQSLSRALYLIENTIWTHSDAHDDNFTNLIKLN